jgi:hypothetical protein
MRVLTKKEKGPAQAVNKLEQIGSDALDYIVSKLEGCSAGCKGRTTY